MIKSGLYALPRSQEKGALYFVTSTNFIPSFLQAPSLTGLSPNIISSFPLVRNLFRHILNILVQGFSTRTSSETTTASKRFCTLWLLISAYNLSALSFESIAVFSPCDLAQVKALLTLGFEGRFLFQKLLVKFY